MESDSIELLVVDAFTAEPFHGNPAAVAIVDEFPSELRMQLIAREMGLSETAFVQRIHDTDYNLRWFTPTTEVDLCGHATLAAAHVLSRPVRFHTKSGVLSCEVRDGWISMDFPADPPNKRELSFAASVTGAVSLSAGRVGALIELESEDLVRSIVPDLALFARLGSTVSVSARSDRDGIDFVSRVFAPAVGIAEDPVTGSAHCMLSEFWGDRLGLSSLIGEQVSARGGIVRMDRRGERVELSGQAVTVSTVRFVV